MNRKNKNSEHININKGGMGKILGDLFNVCFCYSHEIITH